ncbi:MAG: methyltransferase domain-containing protein [Rhodospirillales bacterium]|nr:methyltransferase domain-containing protein [Rhodospirillales bacterium]
MTRPVLINAGCGPVGSARLPTMFDQWQHVRVDIDPAYTPDVVASVTNLSAIPSGAADAVWSAHCVEHLYSHEVRAALTEFYRVLADDGFICVIVPDLQAVAGFIAADKLHDVIYQSAMGPITAHDMLFGFGAAIASGNISMAHRCGFTPTAMLQRMSEVPFDEVVIRRRQNLEIAVVGRKIRSNSSAERDALLAALEL